MMAVVNVLGVDYEIKQSNELEDSNLANNSGYCDSSTKTIVIDTFRDLPGSLNDLEVYRKQVIRHELVHAFLIESGLQHCSWGKDEEIVDWIAIQFPKMKKVFEEINAL